MSERTIYPRVHGQPESTNLRGVCNRLFSAAQEFISLAAFVQSLLSDPAAPFALSQLLTQEVTGWSDLHVLGWRHGATPRTWSTTLAGQKIDNRALRLLTSAD